jgi:Flp pilus assembly protein TadD
MNSRAITFAVSSLALASALVGCTSFSKVNRPADFLAKAPQASKSGRFYQIAQIAVKNGNLGAATNAMEAAVLLSPRDAGYRMGLAELYMRSGRFYSAETTFADATALNPGDTRAGFYLALTRIAQGKTHLALAQLDSMDASQAPADIGLAYAIAGNSKRALELLEPAARSAFANGRIRQNLALAYALAGDWKKAKITAAQDISPSEVNKRMAQWAGLADPSASAIRVAALLGTIAVEDPGQPSQLALAPIAPVAPAAPAAAAFVEAVPPAAPAPVEASPAPVVFAEVPVEAAPAPISVPARFAAADSGEVPAPITAPAVDVPSSPLVFAVAEEAPAPVHPAVLAPEVQIQYAQAAQSLIEPVQPAEAPQPADEVRPTIVPVPVPAFVPSRKVQPGFDPRPRKLGTGRYVVQIGAYRTAAQVETAWQQARRRLGLNGGQEPLSTTVRIPGKGLLHRLSVASFNSQPTAARLCQSIKARGGACFVRATAGDAPLRWVSRSSRNPGRA